MSIPHLSIPHLTLDYRVPTSPQRVLDDVRAASDEKRWALSLSGYAGHRPVLHVISDDGFLLEPRRSYRGSLGTRCRCVVSPLAPHGSAVRCRVFVPTWAQVSALACGLGVTALCVVIWFAGMGLARVLALTIFVVMVAGGGVMLRLAEIEGRRLTEFVDALFDQAERQLDLSGEGGGGGGHADDTR